MNTIHPHEALRQKLDISRIFLLKRPLKVGYLSSILQVDCTDLMQERGFALNEERLKIARRVRRSQEDEMWAAINTSDILGCVSLLLSRLLSSPVLAFRFKIR